MGRSRPMRRNPDEEWWKQDQAPGTQRKWLLRDVWDRDLVFTYDQLWNHVYYYHRSVVQGLEHHIEPTLASPVIVYRERDNPRGRVYLVYYGLLEGHGAGFLRVVVREDVAPLYLVTVYPVDMIESKGVRIWPRENSA